MSQDSLIKVVLLLTISILVIIASSRATAATISTTAPEPPTSPDIARRDLVEPSNIPNGYNASNTVICVYPVSGQYGFLPRLLYYASLTLAILGRYQRWLVMGALASALSYAGSTAIHAMALVSSRKPVFDLDILAAWAVLSTGCMAFVGLVHWSRAMRQSEARLVLVLWGMLVGIGCLFCRAELLDIRSDAEPACRSASGILLMAPYQTVDPQFSNCTYKCFGTKTPMRNPSKISAILTTRLLTSYANLGTILVVPILAAAYKSIALNMHPHTPSELCTRFVVTQINSSLNMNLSQQVYNTACSSWYGGYMVLFHYIHRARLHRQRKARIIAMLIYPWLLLELLFDLAAPPLFITNIVVNEINLMKTSLPYDEEVASIGQWSPIVAAALVVMASVINKGTRTYSARKCRKQVPAQLEEVQTWPRKHLEEENLPTYVPR
ncbi:hypothetical protein ACJ72_06454 [Emergomyces africanus]|uniref:Uncharacterized protein n=1 Tax=Emergomyces africanus TaxID=1955775 RepID=A0A1B7NRH4_9EURO|nr:hypothetical protein ACJ72_06454 [Emergomyces africanus]